MYNKLLYEIYIMIIYVHSFMQCKLTCLVVVIASFLCVGAYDFLVSCYWL